MILIVSDNKTESLSGNSVSNYRAARAHRQTINNMKRQSILTANHPIVASDEITQTPVSDVIDISNSNF